MSQLEKDIASESPHGHQGERTTKVASVHSGQWQAEAQASQRTANTALHCHLCNVSKNVGRVVLCVLL